MTDLTALEVYRRTLIFQKAGMTTSRSGYWVAGVAIQPERGQPTTSVKQFDAGCM